ncbi:MAG: hypothetical protein JNN13_17555 [Planctomycetes bacterium]|nr:hypothetical protein [Planctomycetota bacterium]
MESLRPDLSKILPTPLLRRGSARTSPLAFGLRVPSVSEDFLVDVPNQGHPDADAPGFGVEQAIRVARRLAAVFAATPTARTMHTPDATRARDLLEPPR